MEDNGQEKKEWEQKLMLIRKMAEDQTVKTISTYRGLFKSSQSFVGLYHKFYELFFQQTSIAYASDSNTFNEVSKDEVHKIVESLLKNFQLSVHFIEDLLCTKFRFSSNKTERKQQANSYCKKCEIFIAGKNIELEKMRLCTGQMQDPYNLFGEGVMEFLQELSSDSQAEQQSDTFINQKIIEGHIQSLKVRVEKRSCQLMTILEELEKYEKQVENKDPQKKQATYKTFDRCLKQIFNLLQERFADFISGYLKKAKKLNEKSIECQTEETLKSYSAMIEERSRDSLLVVEKTKEVCELNKKIISLQQQIVEGGSQCEQLKKLNRKLQEENVGIVSIIQKQKTQHQSTNRKLSCLEKQIILLKKQCDQLKLELFSHEPQNSGGFGVMKRNKRSGYSTRQDEDKRNNSELESYKNRQIAELQEKKANIAQNKDHVKEQEEFNDSKLDLNLINSTRFTGESSSKISRNRTHKLISRIIQKKTLDVSNNPSNIEINQKDQTTEMGKKSHFTKKALITDGTKQSSFDPKIAEEQCEVENSVNLGLNKSIGLPSIDRKNSIDQKLMPLQYKFLNTQKQQRISAPTNRSSYHLSKKDQREADFNKLKATSRGSGMGSLNKQPSMNLNLIEDSVRNRKQKRSLEPKQYFIGKSNFGEKENNLSKTIESIYLDRSQFDSILNRTLAEHLGATSADFACKNIKCKDLTEAANLFAISDVENLYFSVEGALEHEKQRKKSYKEQKVFKAEQLKVLTKILTVMASMHSSRRPVYESIKNFLVCPFQSIVSQQNYIYISKSSVNETKIREAINKVLHLHSPCRSDSRLCNHILTFMGKLNQVCQLNQ